MEEPTDEKQIQDVIQGYCDAYDERDLDKCMSFFSDDSRRVRVYAGGDTSIGKAAVRATYAQEFERFDSVDTTSDIPTLNVSGDVADLVYTYRMKFSGLKGDRTRAIATGKGTVKLRKTDGIWKITEVEETIDSWEPWVEPA